MSSNFRYLKINLISDIAKNKANQIALFNPGKCYLAPDPWPLVLDL